MGTEGCLADREIFHARNGPGGPPARRHETGSVAPVRQRSNVRLGQKVIHRHRVGNLEFRRVSELAFIRGTPRAILGWLDVGGVRAPIYLCDLDPQKLRKATSHNTWYYDDTTIDPRYVDVRP
jgi:hypothetical protein